MKPTKTKPQPQQWQSVSEQDDRFLALFPHRFDYLWAEHPDPGDRPDWQTESRYPLSDRLLQQGAYLYGMRFGKLTRYCVLDVDKHSAFHRVSGVSVSGKSQSSRFATVTAWLCRAGWNCYESATGAHACSGRTTTTAATARGRAGSQNAAVARDW